LHAPELSNIQDENHEILKEVQVGARRLGINNIIFHSNSIKDWSIFSRYSFKVLIENTDIRNKTGKDVKDFRKIFRNYNLDIVLDLNHGYTNDRSMKLADDFINNFKHRICEYHISGFLGTDLENRHVPLVKTRQNIILDSIYNKNLPLIIESECESIAEAKREFNYIKNYLLKNK